MNKCLYDLWFDNENTNLNNFTLLIFKAFQAADGVNKSKIIDTWPDWFKDSVNL